MRKLLLNLVARVARKSKSWSPISFTKGGWELRFVKHSWQRTPTSSGHDISQTFQSCEDLSLSTVVTEIEAVLNGTWHHIFQYVSHVALSSMPPPAVFPSIARSAMYDRYLNLLSIQLLSLLLTIKIGSAPVCSSIWATMDNLGDSFA